jgi:hypothetical protein
MEDFIKEPYMKQVFVANIYELYNELMKTKETVFYSFEDLRNTIYYSDEFLRTVIDINWK